MLNISDKIKLKCVAIISGSQNIRKKMNNKIKSYNGNIFRNKIRILSWNKNDGNIADRMDDIKELVRRHSPRVIIIQELNYSRIMCSGITNMNGYSFESDNLINTNVTSRCGMWI